MKALLLAATCAAFFVCPAYAASNSNANASANSSSRASAIGVGNAFGNQSSRSMATGGAGGRGGTASAVNNFTYNDPPAYQGTGSGTGNNVGNTNVHVPLQAPSVFAPSGTSSSCTDTFSFGASGPGGGLSFGLPWRNADCNRRSDTSMLVGLGMKGAARQRMCFDDDTAAAMAAVGFRCRVGKYAKQ